ncbi:MAG: hypothetical protein GXY07_09245 [Candidatus Hydrogenedentes bacterium]|nr:hypothetical protein [Candidatus Hydrogenedentota bacterium]
MTNNNVFDDDRPKNGEDTGADGADGDSGLGNLPPLSEFDSHGGLDAEGDMLPPLGDFESQDSSLHESAQRMAEGGAQAPPPFKGDLASDAGIPDFESSKPGSSDFGMASSGFQDLAADSDFSPETPDIGPGPDSTLDTPIFDSAFGSSDGGFGGSQVSAATQAMETPMFDDFTGGSDFGSPMGATPVPDFSPDTGFGDLDAGMVGAAAGAGAALPPQAGKSGPTPPKKGMGALWVIVIGLISLGVGLIASQPLSSYLGFVPGNPLQKELQSKDSNIANLQRQINTLQQLQATPERPADISPERVAELQNQILVSTQELDVVKGQLDSTRATLDTQQRELATVERDLRERTDEVVAAREFLEELRNETAIVQARQRGLISEVDRLTGYVGELEEANARRIATKQALEHNIDKLMIEVKESIPLTPEKYNYDNRLAAVQALRDKAAQEMWVSPELQNEYTELHLKENELARANDYFFARIPVTDRYGHRTETWAECLMRGNWAVYYRTLDGKNIGSYENISKAETPLWGFKENLPEEVQKGIEGQIINARVPDFEGQVQAIAERELAGREGTQWQIVYSSL